jgi:eukaryotic-like serine/threonine-protein kinase
MPHVTPLRASDPRRVGPYRLTGRIAGMPASGPVYLARSADGSDVTITLPSGDWAAGSPARDRFAAGAAAARLVAPFCAARILDAGLDGDQPFLVSEHVAGASLLEVISDAGERRGTDLDKLAIGAATGLAAIHQAGLVHADFGPEHLILSARGPQVVGFGITPPDGAATPAADMRAWAQTVVFAATGRPPTTPADLDVLPPLLRRVVNDCLIAGPAARPAARQVLSELLGDSDPPAGLLAQGSRRAAGLARLGQTAGQPPGVARQQPAGDGRHRPGGMIWWAAGIVVSFLAAALLVQLTQTGGSLAGKGQIRPDAARPSPAAPRGTAPSPATASSPSPSPPSPSPSSLSPPSPPSPSRSVQAAAAIPAALDGAWSGQVRQGSPAEMFSVTVNLQAGSSSGTISYSGSGFQCTGSLSLVTSTAARVTMRQQIAGGQTCPDGVITLRAGSAPGTAHFDFRGAAQPQAYGPLRAG